jgi:hypothetical protein
MVTNYICFNPLRCRASPLTSKIVWRETSKKIIRARHLARRASRRPGTAYSEKMDAFWRPNLGEREIILNAFLKYINLYLK